MFGMIFRGGIPSSQTQASPINTTVASSLLTCNYQRRNNAIDKILTLENEKIDIALQKPVVLIAVTGS